MFTYDESSCGIVGHPMLWDEQTEAVVPKET
jgi:hypothetical protein